MKHSNLDLVKACDSFPYDGFKRDVYSLLLSHDDRPHGYLLPGIVQRMPWTDAFEVNHDSLTITLKDHTNGTDPSAACSQAFSDVINKAINDKSFDSLQKHSEVYPVVGAKYPVYFERFAGDFFGLTARGAHLTIYVDSKDGMRIWVPRRGPHLFTYPNKLDTTVAGGVPYHQTPFENVVQEADEEASLPADLIKNVRSAGALTYMGLSSHANGGTDRLIATDIVYVFDLEVGMDVKPVPKDGEVKEFYLMTVDEVKEALSNNEFKTNSALVMIDFFIRHGIITAENEPDYVEIITRLHRRLPFPTTP